VSDGADRRGRGRRRRRELPSFWSGDSESEEIWGEVFGDLKSRGPSDVELLASDAHRGMRKTATKHPQGVGWQGCRVHLLRETLAKLFWRDRPALVPEGVAAKWETKSSKLAKAIRAGVEETVAVATMDLPCEHRRRLHSTNMLERLSRE
jgi:transposase-like protein